MRHSKHDDPNLAEVKAVLKRLQRMSRGPQADGTQTVPHELPQVAERLVPGEDSGLSRPVETAAPSQHPNITKRRLVQAAAATAALLAVVAGITKLMTLMASNRQTASVVEPPGDVVRRDSPTAPPTPRASEAPKSPAALRAASALMMSGQVRAARTELLRVAEEGSADVAWALARSYDPNVLGATATADASPDVVEATRWYRTWYGIAVKQGLVADSVSLERIIRSMR